jgi:hypothetical protein
MVNPVAAHYSGSDGLADKIAEGLQRLGKDLNELTTADLATVDEFHIRGRKATMELAEQLKLTEDARVLDVGSGLGGPARTLAEAMVATSPTSISHRHSVTLQRLCRSGSILAIESRSNKETQQICLLRTINSMLR